MHQNDSELDLCSCRCIHEDRVAAAREEAVAEQENQRMARLFKAMGDENRLRLLWALSQGEMCVCDIAAFLRISESAVSHQLRMLRQLQLVCNRREGAVLYYRLADQHVIDLMRTALTHSRE